jgi:hypothetical protein
MLDIITLILVSGCVHFLILVFHNKQSFSLKTLIKALMRIMFFCAVAFCFFIAMKPLIKNLYDELIMLFIVGFFVFFCFYLKDYRDETK